MDGHSSFSSVYDVLPTPPNLHGWRLTEAPGCALLWKTSKPGTHPFILSGKLDRRQVQMVSQSENGHQHPSQRPWLYWPPWARREGRGNGNLGKAKDWGVTVGSRRELKFPEEIAITNLASDTVFWSPHCVARA